LRHHGPAKPKTSIHDGRHVTASKHPLRAMLLRNGDDGGC